MTDGPAGGAPTHSGRFTCWPLTCLGVSSLVGDLVDGVQQSLFVAVGVELELGASVVTKLGDGHLSTQRNRNMKDTRPTQPLSHSRSVRMILHMSRSLGDLEESNTELQPSC